MDEKKLLKYYINSLKEIKIDKEIFKKNSYEIESFLDLFQINSIENLKNIIPNEDYIKYYQNAYLKYSEELGGSFVYLKNSNISYFFMYLYDDLYESTNIEDMAQSLLDYYVLPHIERDVLIDFYEENETKKLKENIKQF